MRSLLLAALVLAVAPLSAQDLPVRTVALNGIEMAYRDVGAGEPLVLLHGFGSCAEESWGPFVGALAARYRLIVPDLRGHGHSTNPAGTFTHRQSSADVLALLDSLGVGRFRAMGISTGGMTLLHAATRQPERVEALVLIGATTYFPEQARALMRGEAFGQLPPEVEAMYRACAPRGDEQVRQLAAQFQGFQHSYDDVTFTPPHLATITARTLVVHGDRDEFFPVEIPVEMYRAIPDAELWIVPGGGHVPLYDPAVPFAATALRFLDGDAEADAADAADADTAAIEAAVARWFTAWETLDAALAAQDYADDADWTNAFGQTARGRAAIERQLTEVFGLGFVTAGQSRPVQQAVRFAGPDVALVRTVVARTGQETAAGDALGTRHTTHLRVFERRGGAWVITSHLISDARDPGAPRH